MTSKQPRRNPSVYGRSTKRVPNQPVTPPAALPEQIWSKIQELIASEPPKQPSTEEAKSPTKRPRGAARRRSRRRRLRRTLDVAGTIVWLVALFKVTTGDLDRRIITAIAPSAAWVVDVPWFFLLLFVALLLRILRARTFALSLAYVVGFPAVILFYKIPRRLVLNRDSIPFVGLIGVVLSLLIRARSFIFVLASASVSGFLILSSRNPWFVGIGMAMMLITLIWSLSQSSIDLIRPSVLSRAQAKAIAWLLSTRFIRQFTTPAQPNQLELTHWTIEDAKKYRDAAGYNLLADQGLRWWEKLLVESRQGPIVAFSGAAIFAIMVIEVIVAFGFINFGAFTIAPDQFHYSVEPDGITFAYYSAVAIYFGEISALTPEGPLATTIKLANGLVGSLGVLTVVGSLLLAYRSSRADSSAAAAAADIQKGRAELEDSARDNFSLEYGDLEIRLIETSWDMLKIFHWLAGKTMSVETTDDADDHP